MKAYFRQWNVNLAIGPGLDVELPIVRRVVPDVERKLAWLRSVPRPVVRELCDLGYHAEVAAALYDWLMPEVASAYTDGVE